MDEQQKDWLKRFMMSEEDKIREQIMKNYINEQDKKPIISIVGETVYIHNPANGKTINFTNRFNKLFKRVVYQYSKDVVPGQEADQMIGRLLILMLTVGEMDFSISTPDIPNKLKPMMEEIRLTDMEIEEAIEKQKKMEERKESLLKRQKQNPKPLA